MCPLTTGKLKGWRHTNILEQRLTRHWARAIILIPCVKQSLQVYTFFMPRGDWSLDICDRHLWYDNMANCWCALEFTFARWLKMTANSEESCKTLTQKCLEEFIKEKKLDQRAQAFFVEDYVYNPFITFHEVECCVMKGKSRMRWKWSSNSATQDWTLCLKDVLAKPGRDIVIISRL